MSAITANLVNLGASIPASVKIVAVSKTKPVEDILEAYNAGQRIFGENRVQEILKKKDQLPSDIEWHMIGHLQSNKVKEIIPYVSMIQSVDTPKLMKVIDSESAKAGRVTNILLQLHIAEEETKTGFSLRELEDALASGILNELHNLRICGVMGMATFTDNESQIRKEFKSLSDSFKILRQKYFPESFDFAEISMGMSGDHRIAVDEGSTMIRVGSLIFGERIRG
ncbi:MAG TPA: YggS family pyridoxal phosphate-dependent enzyme [Bacteroidales bacterium]|jgi:pyridoxal phosphate enzyme (YggS family)|nr:YggS family pyridoxal phosphate-dependent enzyme [Bacteroidales bacterium]